jgi:hypothetical protein
VGGDVPVNSKSLLVTDFMNLKIKLTQFFRGVHMNRMCIRIFIEVSAHMRMSICVCTVFLKKLMTFLASSTCRSHISLASPTCRSHLKFVTNRWNQHERSYFSVAKVFKLVGFSNCP